MTGYLELIIFTVCALGAVWARGKLDTVATAAAVLIAYGGIESQGWIGWSWSWGQAAWYAGLTLGIGAVLAYIYRDRLAWRGRKPAVDYLALGIWGAVQQGVLLGWLAVLNPWAAVGVFAIVHLPNRLLATVTFVGGGASVAIAQHFGVPCILAAGLSHALLSFVIRDIVGASMCVGEGCSEQRDTA